MDDSSHANLQRLEAASVALSLRATVDIEVREISPEVGNFGFVLDAREHHLVPGNLPPRIGDERGEAGPIPDEACVLTAGATNPLSSGPNLFFAPTPTAWQAWHL